MNFRNFSLTRIDCVAKTLYKSIRLFNRINSLINVYIYDLIFSNIVKLFLNITKIDLSCKITHIFIAIKR